MLGTTRLNEASTGSGDEGVTIGKAGAREAFDEAAGLPTPGARVCLSGFSKAGHAEAAALLALHRLKATSFLAGADAVLVPDAASAEVVAEAKKSGRRVLVMDDLRRSTPEEQRRGAVEVGDDFVRVLDVRLPRRPEGGRFVPPVSRFRHLCLDAPFLRAARAAAIAVRDGLPCAFEGETATAKTTAVLWLASLCRQGVVRLNLNGQSDAGELVGRYVPAGEEPGHALPEADEAPELDGTDAMARRSNAGSTTPSWRFWEGCIPQAMREGLWVLLDEVNLAEPQVLERLNPVLETPPSLVLSEHDGKVFGEGGDVPVDPHFRLFATMNPAEYSGRSVLSPAFRDRWTLWTFVEAPGEGELKAMLRCLATGEQPEFTQGGTLWRAEAAAPVHPELTDAPGVGEKLDRLAAFHMAVASASGNTGGAAEVGRARRERYVFTRRTLLSTMKLWAAGVGRGAQLQAALVEAMELMYVERVAPGPDRQAVRSALRAVGLSA